MTLRKLAPTQPVVKFNREFFESHDDITAIGNGELGGKGSGLAFIREVMQDGLRLEDFPEFTITIPRMCVVTTEVFETFMTQNNLYEIALSDMRDDRIAHAFQKAEFPPQFIGDLLGLVSHVHQPLAVRSSSLLEDTLTHPFAGVYATKMISNNAPDAETRFHKLVEAVKFVWASTFFEEAKAYASGAGQNIEHEKMGVIIQEIVGLRHGERFYPNLAGVARSYSFYPMGTAKHDDGVVDLALGLGKTIMDGGIVWSYGPANPKANPLFNSTRELLERTQTKFFAVNMGKPPAYDPIRETEYLVHKNLSAAEGDGMLNWVASTYDAESDRIVPGIASRGPRVLNFAPILVDDLLPLNTLVRRLLTLCQDAVGAPVEIEFAVTFDPSHPGRARFGFLQVRPMMVSHDCIDIADDEMTGESVLASSDAVMGNGTDASLCDVVYVVPETFEARHTPIVAEEVAAINRELAAAKVPYLLIGFGRWGSSDPWLGIPVVWSQISGARALLEATLPDMNVELSHGSHFFHNLTSFQVGYFPVRHDSPFRVQWEWLARQERVTEKRFVRHIRTATPLDIKVDGRSGRGVIRHE